MRGTGNIKYLQDPDVDFPTEFELYTPQHNVDADIVNNNVTGEARTEFTFIPKEVGNYSIKVPDFVYFDTKRMEYVTIEMPDYELKVSKGLSNAAADKQDVTAKNTDIIYIKTGDLDLSSDHEYFIDKGWYWIVYVLLVAGLLGAIFYTTRSGKRAADVTGMRRSKANKVARKRLSLAHKYLVANNSEKFYAETLRALWGYLSDKLSIPAANMSRATVVQQLTERGVSDELCQRIVGVLDTCEMARYTPSGDIEENKSVYHRATESINELEKTKLKVSKNGKRH